MGPKMAVLSKKKKKAPQKNSPAFGRGGWLEVEPAAKQSTEWDAMKGGEWNGWNRMKRWLNRNFQIFVVALPPLLFLTKKMTMT